MKRISIHQPCYLPYLGLFYKIWKSDEFVYLDDAQYSNGYVFDFNRIKTPQGEMRIKVPLEKKFGNLLTEVVPKNFLGWREKHLKAIAMNYKRADYFNELFFSFQKLLMADYSNLADMNIALTDFFIDWFGFRVKTHKSSSMAIFSRAEARVIEIVKALDGKEYISGIGGKNYQSEENFTKASIKLTYAQFTPIQYKQQWKDFLPYMSVIDYALNEGHDIQKLFEKMEK